MQSRRYTIIGWIMSGLVIAFLLLDGIIKLIPLDVVITTSQQLGVPVRVIFLLGVLTVGCTLLYAIPATAVFGAILLTGYIGGAMYAHVLAQSPLFTHTFFGLYLSLLIWGGLWFRDPRVRALLPFVK